MKTKLLFISLTLGLGLTLALLWLLGGGSTPVAAAPAERPLSDATPIHYVAITGTNSGNCSTPAAACRIVQYAVDKAGTGDEILVASGVYTDVNNYGELAQVVYISKTVTIRGGYTTTNWTMPYPITQPTTLDAQGRGRVLYITGNISPTIEGLRITGGYTDDDGGGICVRPAGATISNNQVFSNTAHEGGGLYLFSSYAVTLTNNTVTSNTASSTGGGGGLKLESGNATLSGNTIASNITTIGDGGGLYLGGGYPMLTDNAIVSNTAAYGGGLYLNGTVATLSGNNVASNTAGYGGGLYLYRSFATLSGNTVISNTARWGGGGGLFLGYQGDATLTSNVIANNRALTAGSGLYIDGSQTRLLHTTIARNSGGNGSGVYIGGPVALTNTILFSHTVGISVTDGNTATLNATLWHANTTNWNGNVIHTNDYTGDPAFVNPNAGDYHIGTASAAIDKGVDAGVTDDIDGDPRPQGGGYDLGADELVGAAPGGPKIYLPLIMRQYP